MWQPVLKWLMKYVWPSVQRVLAAQLIALVTWIIGRLKAYFQEYFGRKSDEAKQKREEAERRAKEAREQAEKAQQKAQAAEAKASRTEAQKSEYVQENEELKAEIERLKSELEKTRLQAEADKQTAIAEVWREVSAMLSKDQKVTEDRLQRIHQEAVSHAKETVANLNPDDVFPKDIIALPPPEENQEDDQLMLN